MKTRYFLAAMALVGGLTACNADMDYTIADPIITAPEASAIQGALNGDNYVISWTGSTKMQVTRFANGTQETQEIADGSYTHKNVETNIDYMYILKATDGKGNFSKGVITNYTRPGAGKCSKVSMAQVEKSGGYDATVEWSIEGTNATHVNFLAENGNGSSLSAKLPASITNMTIEDVKEGETWTVTLVAENEKGKSLPVKSSLKIGKLAVAYLSIYDTPEELIANGDDDEAYGWIWFHANYPNGKFLPFSEIYSADVLEPYRVAFFMRDIDFPKRPEALNANGGWIYSEFVKEVYPEVVMNATKYIKEWYKGGGNLLLWSHASFYVAQLGRIDEKYIIGGNPHMGYGGDNNPDTWPLSVQLNTGSFIKDNSGHPLFKGLDAVSVKHDGADTKYIYFKNGAFTEDHNCLFFDLPTNLTKIGNGEEACYNAATQTYGIYPLGTWDGQCHWISQLNVWEAQPGNSGYQGTIICVGNGGCNFYLKQADGSFDVEKQKSTNQYQGNIERMAKNAIEYLKTR